MRISKSSIGPYDILCGRSRASYHNVGNRRFRITIGAYLPKYINARTRYDKTSLIIFVVRLLHDDVGARFLKQNGVNMYVQLDEKEARKKVGHAFRDMVAATAQEAVIIRPTVTETKCDEPIQELKNDNHSCSSEQVRTTSIKPAADNEPDLVSISDDDFASISDDDLVSISGDCHYQEVMDTSTYDSCFENYYKNARDYYVI